MPFVHEDMHFAIEVPSAANPLDSQTLFNTLTRAASTDRLQLQTATQQLQNWEKYPGFYSSLQTVFINKSLPLEVRYLSAIQLKNGIDKYWRKSASNSISKEEKALIRSRALESGINEPDHRLALQNALVIAKITRFEFPHEWPDAIISATNYLRLSSKPGADPIHLPRTLIILLYIIKELSTARLQRSRTSLQSATPEVFQVLGKVYVDKVHSWLHLAQNNGNDGVCASQEAAVSLLAIRTIRRLIVAGYEFPNRHNEVLEFWGIARNQFGDMLALVTQQENRPQEDLRLLVEKHLMQLSKLHLEMVKTHPSAFALLTDSIGLVKAYWGLLGAFSQTFGAQSAVIGHRIGADGDAGDEQIPCVEKLSLKGLLILRACVKMVYSPSQSFKYQYAQDKEERKHSVALIKDELLTESVVREMMETLVTRFFVFRPQDLRAWEEEPTEWERREEGEGDIWEFSVRQCAEKLFLDLVINNKDLLVQPLLNVFYSVATPQNSDILLKDSIYAAVGLAAPVLEDNLDFGAYIESALVPEIQMQQPGYNLLRRRIAIVLGQWVQVKEGLNRPLIYQVFQYLLDKDDKLNDKVVRVTAGRQLKNIIDPWEFVPESFMPYAPTLISRIMGLIEDVELSETKMALLNTINIIVIRMQQHITPFADAIVSLLPPLWAQAGDEGLMKQSILTILVALINSMYNESHRFQPLILPLIQSSIDPNSESREYLLEDGLDLWSSILAQAPSSSPEIFALTDYLFLLFDTAAETLRKALEITESYILLAPEAMLQSSPRFLSSFANLLATKPKREASGLITRLVELFIQAAEALGGKIAVDHLIAVFIDTHLLQQLLTNLRSAHDAHQTTGPNRPSTSIDGIIETDHLSILARLALASPHTFIQNLNTISPSDEIITWLLTEWFSHFESMGNPERKKLSCLALTALLDFAPQPWILSRLQELMSMWTDVVTECVDYPEDNTDEQDETVQRDRGPGRDVLVYSDPEGLKPTDRPEAAEEERKRNVLFADPVHRVDIKVFIRERVEQAVQACGGQDAFQRDWLVNVDADVVKGFGGLGVL